MSSDGESSSDVTSGDTGSTASSTDSMSSGSSSDADTTAPINKEKSKHCSQAEIQHVRKHLTDIVTRKDKSKLGHVEKLVQAFASSKFAFDLLQAKVKKQFGEIIPTYSPENANLDDAVVTEVVTSDDAHKNVTDKDSHMGQLSTEDIEQVRIQLTEIILSTKPRKQKNIPKLINALSNKTLPFEDLQMEVLRQFQSKLIDPRHKDKALSHPIRPLPNEQTIVKESNSQNQTSIKHTANELDTDKVIELVRSLLAEHDPTKVNLFLMRKNG